LFNLVRSLPTTLKYEHDLILAEGDYVISHGRFSGRGSAVNWIAAEIRPDRTRNAFQKTPRALAGFCLRRPFNRKVVLRIEIGN
jgi:hypothetical protein